MAKLKSEPIKKEDIEEYLTEYSNFSFEVEILRELTLLGFSCEHSGTYEDPVTNKTREFDIRARQIKKYDEKLKFNISLSIECKNLKNNFPLVIHCMPREEAESYLDLIWSSEPSSFIPPYENSMRVTLENHDCPYERLMAVGKASDQVGRKAAQNSELIGNDGDVFEKISQAINSAYDLIKEAHYAADKSTDVVTIVVPVLVVPNDCIWSVWYKKTGEIEREPTLESNIEYFIDKSWLVGHSSEFQRCYYLSHLEIVQKDSLRKMINKYRNLPSVSSFEKLALKRYAIIEQSGK